MKKNVNVNEINNIKFIDMIIHNNYVNLVDNKGKKYKYETLGNNIIDIVNDKRMDDIKSIVTNFEKINSELVIYKNIENRVRLSVRKKQLLYGTSDILLENFDEKEYIRSIMNDYIDGDIIISKSEVYKINENYPYQKLILIDNNKRIRIIGLDLILILDDSFVKKLLKKRGV